MSFDSRKWPGGAVCVLKAPSRQSRALGYGALSQAVSAPLNSLDGGRILEG